MTWAEAPGAPWWFLLALAVAGAFVGEVLRRRVATGGYRLDDETGPLPRVPSGVVPVALALLWGLLGWRFGPLSDWALTPAYLAFAFVAVALAWIDADVHRLPRGQHLQVAQPVLPSGNAGQSTHERVDRRQDAGAGGLHLVKSGKGRGRRPRRRGV